MPFSFDLTSQPWVPVLGRDGVTGELSLRDVLVNAHELVELAGDSPLVTVALTRLLIALAHRVVAEDGQPAGPSDRQAWRALWQAKQFDTERVDAYLGRWRHRFDAFDERRPFMQDPAIVEGTAGEPRRLLWLADNNPLLFEHDRETIASGRALRLLLAVQLFDTGGIIPAPGAPGGKAFARSGPLLQGAVTLLRGTTLAETLLLNLQRYSPDNGRPWEFSAARDAPAWEREQPVTDGVRSPDGYLDLLTWQSRRCRLFVHETTTGMTRVHRVAVFKGEQFPDGFERVLKEPMIPFRASQKGKDGPIEWLPTGFREERAAWRDANVFLQAFTPPKLATGTTIQPPPLLAWVSELVGIGFLDRNRPVVLELQGLAADQAKLLFWRREQVAVPASFLDESDPERQGLLREKLHAALHLAEQVGRLLGPSMTQVAADERGKPMFVAPMRKLSEELARLTERRAMEGLVEQLAPARRYWAALEAPFRDLLVRLPEDVRQVDGEPEFGGTALPQWAALLQREARRAYREGTDSLAASGRALRAVALGERELVRGLALLLKDVLPRPAPAPAATAL